MKFVTFFVLTLILTCQSSSQREKSESNKKSELTRFTIKGAIGVIVTNDNYHFGDTIHVLDSSKQLLREIVITDENQELSLRCLAKDEKYYKVQIDDSKVGLIDRDEKGVMFQSWEEHIMSVFAIGFDEQSNPLRQQPSEKSEVLYYDHNEFYHPSQIKGEWLQLKWGSEGDWQYGWVKWTDGEKLVIELFYFA